MILGFLSTIFYVTLFIWILFEIVSYVSTGVGLLQRFIIVYRLRKQINKLLIDYCSPNEPYWELEGIDTISMHKSIKNKIHPDYGKISVYVKITSKIIPGHRHNWTNEFLFVNYFGKIVKKHGLLEAMKLLDHTPETSNSIKEFSREEKLKKLGI